jgi:hypothetical protein
MIVTAKRMQWPFRFCSEILHLHLEIIHRFDPFFFFCGLCTSSVFPLWCTQQQQQRLGEQQQHVSTRRTSISAFSITLHISTHAQKSGVGPNDSDSNACRITMTTARFRDELTRTAAWPTRRRYGARVQPLPRHLTWNKRVSQSVGRDQAQYC